MRYFGVCDFFLGVGGGKNIREWGVFRGVVDALQCLGCMVCVNVHEVFHDL